MTNDLKSGNNREGTARSSWSRRADDVKIEFGFGMPLGSMSAHPVFHSAWDLGW